ncbi:MAG: hypothetical protein N3D14_02295 [Aquificaceae bacterium]|nr:hypothetical protein [Aquificaceae bacterium]MCX8164208.1 hypothetical protein [Aquificaceae bacterium]
MKHLKVRITPFLPVVMLTVFLLVLYYFLVLLPLVTASGYSSSFDRLDNPYGLCGWTSEGKRYVRWFL